MSGEPWSPQVMFPWFQENNDRDFPGGSVAKSLHSTQGGPGLIPGQGTRPHMLPQLRVHMLCAASSRSVVPNSVTPWTVALQAVHWNSPGKNTGVGCHALLQGIFLPQGSNPCLLSAFLALAGGFFFFFFFNIYSFVWQHQVLVAACGI